MSGIDDITAERKRQIEQEGWSPEHDDAHSQGDLLNAAICYADPSATDYMKTVPHHWDYGRSLDDVDQPIGEVRVPQSWPWDGQWWKPGDRRRDLVRAAALIAAEIDRLDRQALKENQHD